MQYIASALERRSVRVVKYCWQFYH